MLNCIVANFTTLYSTETHEVDMRMCYRTAPILKTYACTLTYIDMDIDIIYRHINRDIEMDMDMDMDI